MKKLLAAVAWLAPASVLALVAVDVVTARGIHRDRLEAEKGRAEQLLGERSEPVELAPRAGDDELRIWLIGASTFAAPDRIIFPEKLAARYGKVGRTVVIDNLAWEGFTTANLTRRTAQAVAIAKAEGITPDVAVYYEGHNDVTTTYHAAMGFPAAAPTAFPVSALTALPAWVWTAGWQEFPDGGGYRFFRNRRVGALLRLYQQLGLVAYTPEDFAPLDAHILTNFIPNLEATRQAVAGLGADFIVVTPVGNLLARPYGPNQVVDPLYEAGVAATDYDARMKALLAARDAESFSSDMRAKTPMIEAIRTWAGTRPDPARDLRLCDLERAFLDQQAPLDDTMFIDPLHFSDAGFEAAADVIFGCLQAWDAARATP